MKHHDPVPWHDLSESARGAVCRAIRTLASGYTGRISMDANQGGVTRLTEERPKGLNPDGSRNVEVHTFDARELKRAS